MIRDASNKKRDFSVSVLKDCYHEASKRLINAASEAPLKEPELQTTLIAAIETQDSFFITYLGDGDIWLRRGDGWAIPLMMPHKKGGCSQEGLQERV